MVKTIIVDDEQHCINWLKDLLNQQPEVEILAEYRSVQDALKLFKNFKPDLLFLDVQIHDKTGFDLLKELERVDFEVIFTTAHDKYAVEAFKFSAVDYLLKPIDEIDLKLALEKLSSKLKAKDFSSKMNVLLSNIQNNGNKKITIPTQDGFIFQDVSEIIRCQSEGNYTNIFIKNIKKPILVSKTLKIFEEMLEGKDFFRIHNSHLINLKYVSKYTKGKGGYVTMRDNTIIEVSIRKKEAFLKLINR
ncbi:LytR/AlgR family response regulator transcription factor [Psychroserpens mesophilus]|uniref:LytR/AlgR family response regulator transcription factor n=1 Tax=Psychroserpens mesophilus TaxID=325473 RepID=UPI003D64AC77